MEPVKSPLPKTETSSAIGTVDPIWIGLVGFLWSARYLRPENAEFGETLWISGLWLALSAIWFLNRARAGVGPLRLGIIEWFAGGLAVAHWLAVLPVLIEGGDRRAAANIAWEWVGVAASVILVRQVVDRAGLRSLLVVTVGVLVALAALGVWQHHVAIPALANQYGALVAEAEQLRTTGESFDRLAEIEQELATYGVPADPSARARWENRLRHSSEPFATFALANTLAGFLALNLCLLVGWVLTARGTRAAWEIGFAALLVLYCLVLTKSRTGWVGFAAGIGVAGIWMFARKQRWGKTSLRWVFGGVVTAIVVAGAGALGLDREVFSEAPKSLQYRLEYWEGTLGVLAENPLLGTGPGNFRGHYLEHRPVGASEAIAAPHNWLLEIWCASGLLGLMLMLGFCGYVGGRMLRARGDEALAEEDLDRSRMLDACAWGGLAAFPAVAMFYFLGGSGMDWRLWAILPVYAGVVGCLRRGAGSGFERMGVMGGLVALLVHLLGADGIEYPVVIQTLFLLAIVVEGALKGHVSPVKTAWRMAATMGALCTGLLLTGIVPVLNSAAHLMQAQRMAAEGSMGASTAIDAAALADGWSLSPLIMRAELRTNAALANPSGRADDAAVAAWEEVLAAEPRHLMARLRLGELYLARFETDGKPESAEKAAEEFRLATRLSPTDVVPWQRLAIAEAAGGDEAAARRAAGRARDLDEINRRRGHLDVLLDAGQRAQLEEILDAPR